MKYFHGFFFIQKICLPLYQDMVMLIKLYLNI
jgi:hypothetical protein